MKKCNTCGIVKSESEFQKSKSKADGLQSKCKACRKIDTSKTSEKKKEYDVEYRIQNRDKLNAQQKDWAENNAERKREQQKIWEAENRAARNKYKNDWAKGKV
jgi:hypothetical protein